MNNIIDEASPSKKTRKTSSKKKVQVLVEDHDLDQAESDNQLPALMDETPMAAEDRLRRIEAHLNSLLKRQQTGVSAEFNALMDGYVNKANESQEYKVQFDHIETQHEELQLEHKTIKEENKKLKSDLEAAKEALRLSESDLQRNKREADNTRMQFEEQVSNLIEDRERLKAKVKQLMDHKEQSTNDYNDLKAELLEHKYRAKQLEQEKQVEVETSRRSVHESNKIIDELKDKLDLRTREVEYKDALLNQLIKQVSADETFNMDFLDQPPGAAMQDTIMTSQSNKAPSAVKIDDRAQGSSWGSFRK